MALLLPKLLAPLRPGKMHNRHPEEAVAVILQPSEGVVPRRKRGQHAERAAADLQVAADGDVPVGEGVVLAGEEEEAEVEGEEEEEEGDGGPHRAEEEHGGEDEPAGQEEADGRVVVREVGGVGPVRGGDAPVGREQDAVGDPEAAVGREGGGAKGVAYGHLPACEISHLNSWEMV